MTIVITHSVFDLVNIQDTKMFFLYPLRLCVFVVVFPSRSNRSIPLTIFPRLAASAGLFLPQD